MQVFHDPAAFQKACTAAVRLHGELGFVPTMGNLHAGHESLMRLASRHRSSALSIFVNPSQFGPTEDLSSYPRTLDADLVKARACGIQYVLVPTPETMYPPGFQTWVEPGALASELEGAYRPGHMRGVATIVLKLFNLARPTHAYFGAKDYQQLAVVRCLARDLSLDLEVVGAPTIREGGGLALSSRNAYLSAEERVRALSLRRALLAVSDAFDAGEANVSTLEVLLRSHLDGQVDAIDYAVVRDADTLETIDVAQPERAVALIAARVGRTRLIDNAVLG